MYLASIFQHTFWCEVSVCQPSAKEKFFGWRAQKGEHLCEVQIGPISIGIGVPRMKQCVAFQQFICLSKISLGSVLLGGERVPLHRGPIHQRCMTSQHTESPQGPAEGQA